MSLMYVESGQGQRAHSCPLVPRANSHPAMSLSVSFRHSARAEFIEAAAWYESERQNLGVEFIAEIETANLRESLPVCLPFR